MELTGEDITDEPDSGNSRRGALVIPAEADFLVAYSSPPGNIKKRRDYSTTWLNVGRLEFEMNIPKCYASVKLVAGLPLSSTTLNVIPLAARGSISAVSSHSD